MSQMTEEDDAKKGMKCLLLKCQCIRKETLDKIKRGIIIDSDIIHDSQTPQFFILLCIMCD